MNGQRIIKLLELAGRSSSNDNEALNALRMVSSQLEAGGFTWGDLPTILGVDASLLAGPVPKPIVTTVTKTVTKKVTDPALVARVDELEQLVRAGDAVVNTLRQELRAARSGATKPAHQSPPGVSWNVFSKIAEKLLGQDWKSHHQRFGASQAMLSRWEKQSLVPPEYLEKLSGCRSAQIERKPRHR